MQSGLNQAEAEINALSDLGKLLAKGVVNPLTDALAFLTGVMVMLKSGTSGQLAKVAAAGVGVCTQAPTRHRDDAVGYRGWSRVFVRPNGENTGFLFRRDGLFSRKPAGVRMA